MRTASVTVLPYDRAWKRAFADIKEEIEAALEGLILGIEHVGSTSVEGLSAKPCIDLDVVIRDYSVFAEVVARLVSSREPGFWKPRQAGLRLCAPDQHPHL